MSSLGDLVVFPLRRKSFASQVLEVSKKLDKYYLGEELQGLLNDWTSRYSLPPQPVDATHALNLSAGVSKPNVLRGRSLSCRATAFSLA